MAFVMSGGMVQLPPSAAGVIADVGVQNTDFQGQGRGRGYGGINNRGSGREINVGYTKNENRQVNSWEQRSGAGYNNNQTPSDAVVLGGGSTESDYTDFAQQHTFGMNQEQYIGEESGMADTGSQSKSGGKMQRVGDRWVWQPHS